MRSDNRFGCRALLAVIFVIVRTGGAAVLVAEAAIGADDCASPARCHWPLAPAPNAAPNDNNAIPWNAECMVFIMNFLQLN